MTGWIEFFVNGLAIQMKEIVDRGKRLIRRDVIAHEYRLNQLQVLAVERLLEQEEIRIDDMVCAPAYIGGLCSGIWKG